jgi:hypothetical protein
MLNNFNIGSFHDTSDVQAVFSLQLLRCNSFDSSINYELRFIERGQTVLVNNILNVSPQTKSSGIVENEPIRERNNL